MMYIRLNNHIKGIKVGALVGDLCVIYRGKLVGDQGPK